MSSRRRILIINGHPDPSPERFCASLCEGYAAGAEAGGHDARLLSIGALDFPLIRNREAFETGAVPDSIAEAQRLISWAEHLVIIHPLWLGSAPALLKGFMEQAFRYGFAIPKPGSEGGMKGLLKGRSAHIVVTMGMPAAVYRVMFGGFGVRAMERGILRLSGITPIRHSFVGLVEGSARARKTWLARMDAWGRAAT